MFFGSVVDVPRRLFVLFVTLTAVVPRMPFDTPYSIGGNLSNPFRKLLLAIACLHFFRHFGGDDASEGMKLSLMALESSSLFFLSLLTPFLLRRWLSERINIPGGQRPGRALMPWVYAFVVLSALGVIARSVTKNPHMWIFKKIGDALSFIPVMRTLKWYNDFSTGGARYPGRGPVLSQFVMVGEYYCLFAHMCDICIKFGTLGGLLDDSVHKTVLVKGMFSDNHFAFYSRVLCHAVLLNTLDETYQLHTPSSPSNQENEQGRGPNNSSEQHDSESRIEILAKY